MCRVSFKGLNHVSCKDARRLKDRATRSVSRPCRYAKFHSAVFFQRVEPSRAKFREEGKLGASSDSNVGKLSITFA